MEKCVIVTPFLMLIDPTLWHPSWRGCAMKTARTTVRLLRPLEDGRESVRKILPCSFKECQNNFAPGEAQTHGLQVMRLTRCLLRYRGWLKTNVSILQHFTNKINDFKSSLSGLFFEKRLFIHRQLDTIPRRLVGWFIGWDMSGNRAGPVGQDWWHVSPGDVREYSGEHG